MIIKQVIISFFKFFAFYITKTISGCKKVYYILKKDVV